QSRACCNGAMNDLLTRQLMAEADEHEERKLLEWRRASPANEARYARLARVWKNLEHVRARVGRPAPDAKKVIEAAGRGPGKRGISPSTRWLRWWRWLPTGALPRGALA